MSVKVASNRLIVPSLKRYAGFYQQLFQSVSGFQELGRSIIGAAETAIALRQIDRLEELGSILSNLPLEEYRVIGHYYQAWCSYRRGENSRAIFESVIEQSDVYRARAFISLAALEARSGDYTSELNCYTEAIKYARNPTTLVTALRASAVVKAKEGYRKQALKDLENLMPLARFAKPHLYYDFLNSLAVELCEAGRLEEARNISNIVLASPYVFAYPEWRETRDEIELKAYRLSRSAVSFAQKPIRQNVLYLPERTNDKEEYSPNPFQPQGIVVKLNSWKNKMVKEPNGNDDKEKLDDLSGGDLVMKLLNLVTDDSVTDEQRLKILEYAAKVISQPKK